ncbi:MAG TPA: STAS domain-containing protein [Actinomycetota bacterium]|jgi:anti-anti-sigma factor|nr:STAS domain-containing protein [Actinomycetota bacterium]
MPGAEFRAEVRQHDRTGVIDLHGEINLGADQALAAAYEAAVRGDPTTVVLNFAHVDYINSTGIALIVGLLARARKEHRTVRAFGLSEHYRQIFDITRLSDFMGIYPDEDSAVTATAAATS